MDIVIRRPRVLRRPPRPAFVAGPGGGHRRLTVLDPLDARTYERLVARVAPAVERALGHHVVANRVVGSDLRLEDWRIAHRRWRRATGRSEPGGLRLHLDVADCYGSIRPEVVDASLRSLGSEPSLELLRLLRELAEQDVPGLPVGPDASAVLANAVLRPMDLAVRAAGAAHVRWVDDVVVVVRSRRHAIRVLDGVRRELASLGLTLQDAKTCLVEDPRDAPSLAVSSPQRRVR